MEMVAVLNRFQHDGKIGFDGFYSSSKKYGSWDDCQSHIKVDK